MKQRSKVWAEWDQLAVIALGGGLGGASRYLVSALVAAQPVGTMVVNLLGSGLMGALLAVVEGRRDSRLWRQFLGTGFLGGFTTVSAFALDAHRLATTGPPFVALAYLVLTPIGAVLAFALVRSLTNRALNCRGAR